MVSWSEVTKPKSYGGLGIVPHQVRNQALLCIWSWRFGKEREVLWAKVLTARYALGDGGGWMLGEQVERIGSHVVKVWWRIGRGVGPVGRTFQENLRLLVGNGDRASFGRICGSGRDP